MGVHQAGRQDHLAQVSYLVGGPEASRERLSRANGLYAIPREEDRSVSEPVLGRGQDAGGTQKDTSAHGGSLAIEWSEGAPRGAPTLRAWALPRPSSPGGQET